MQGQEPSQKQQNALPSQAVSPSMQTSISISTAPPASVFAAPFQFTGDINESFQQWKEAFERYAILQNFDSQRKLACFPCFLNGAALTAYNDVIHSIEAPKSYEDIISQIGERFPEGRNSSIKRMDLVNRHQKEGESVAVYAQVMRELVKAAYPLWNMSMQYEIAKDFFIHGLQPSIRRWTVHARPTNFEEAVRIAQEEELNNQMQATNEVEAKMNQLNLDRRLNSIERQLARKQPAQNRPNQNHWFTPNTNPVNSLNKDITCFYCGEQGHYASTCRKRAEDQARRRQGPVSTSNQVFGQNNQAMRNNSVQPRGNNGMTSRPRINAIVAQDQNSEWLAEEHVVGSNNFYEETDPYFEAGSSDQIGNGRLNCITSSHTKCETGMKISFKVWLVNLFRPIFLGSPSHPKVGDTNGDNEDENFIGNRIKQQTNSIATALRPFVVALCLIAIMVIFFTYNRSATTVIVTVTSAFVAFTKQRNYVNHHTMGIEHNNDSTLICIKIFPSGKLVQSLVDTGSTISLIKRCIVEELGITVQSAKVWNIQVANQEVTKTIGQVNLRFEVTNGQCFDCHLYVIENCSFDIIFGKDFMKQKSTTIFQWRKRKVQFGDIKVDLVNEENWQDRAATLLETVTLMPRTTRILRVKVPPQYESVDCVMFEPDQEKIQEYPVIVANSISRISNGSTIIEISNITNAPIKLYKNTRIGRLQVHATSEEDATSGALNAIENLKPSYPSNDGDLDVDLSKSNLTSIEREQLLCTLRKFKPMFGQSTMDFGRTDLIEHSILTGEHPPIKQRPYRLAPKQREEINKQVTEMLKKGVIQHSKSPWASPVVLVPKKDGSERFCVDFRKLNAITHKDSYPLPRIDDIFDAVSRADYFTSLDQASGYWQIPVNEKDREKTAFITYNGLYEFLVMPFGLTSAPATFQRLMDVLLVGLQWETCLVYLDDVLVFGKTFQEHLERLDTVLTRLMNAGLKLRLKKCRFASRNIVYLGHKISKDGISPESSKVEAVQAYAPPTTVTQLRSFLGLASYYRRFIKNFSIIARPLFSLLKKGCNYEWKADQEAAFQKLKEALVTAPVLITPNYSQEFILQTDASVKGVGVVLSQIRDGADKPVAYASRVLQGAESKYPIYQLEMLAVVYGIQTFRHYLYQQHFTVYTDNAALKTMLGQKNLSGRIGKWIMKLQEYNFDVKFRHGRQNANADFLSRQVCAIVEDQAQAPIRDWNIKEAQNQDHFISAMVEYLTSGNLPEEEAMAIHISLVSPHYAVVDELLVRIDVESKQLPRIVVPTSYMDNILKENHDQKDAGHLGFKRTYERITKNYFWPNMYASIKNYCERCWYCTVYKPPHTRTKADLVSIPVKGPFHRVSVDFIGPLPRSSLGHRYIIVFVDYLTKYAEARATKNCDARTAAGAFMDLIVLRHSAPEYLHPDRGPAFISHLMQEICAQCGCQKSFTSGYRPNCNGLVERLNRTLIISMSMFVNNNKTNWNQVLSYALFAYNSSKQETTKYSPFYLVYGREAVFPTEATNYNLETQLDLTEEEYADQVRQNLDLAREIASQNIQIAQQKQTRLYNRKARNVEIHPGDIVVKENFQARKFDPKWSGPYQVEQVRYPNVTIRAADYENAPTETAHVDQLKKDKTTAVASIQVVKNSITSMLLISEFSTTLTLQMILMTLAIVMMTEAAPFDSPQNTIFNPSAGFIATKVATIDNTHDNMLVMMQILPQNFSLPMPPSIQCSVNEIITKWGNESYFNKSAIERHCDELNSQKASNMELFDELKKKQEKFLPDLIQEWTENQSNEGQHQRRKRWIPILSDIIMGIGGWIGFASTKQVQQIEESTTLLEKQTSLTHAEVKRLGNEHVALAKVTDERLQQQSKLSAINHQHILELNETIIQLFNIRSIAESHLEYGLNRLTATLWLQNYFSKLFMESSGWRQKAELLLALIDVHQRLFRIDLNEVVKGYIPMRLVPPQKLRDIIKSVQQQLHNLGVTTHLSFDSNNITALYHQPYSSLVIKGGQIFIAIRMPVGTETTVLDLWRLHTLPIPLAAVSNWSTLIKLNYTWIASTRSLTHYVLLTDSDLALCQKLEHYFCPSKFALFLHTVYSCEWSLLTQKFNNDSKCSFTAVPTSNQPIAKAIGDDFWLLLDPKKNWKIQCPKEEKVLNDCEFCIQKQPCQCSLESNGLFLPPITASCSNQTIRQTLYPISSSLFKYLLPIYPNLDRNAYLPGPIRIPQKTVNFTRSDTSWDQILEASRISEIDYEKLMKLATQNKKIYASRSDAIQAEIDSISKKSAYSKTTSEIWLSSITVLVAVNTIVSFATCYRILHKITFGVIVLNHAVSGQTQSLDQFWNIVSGDEVTANHQTGTTMQTMHVLPASATLWYFLGTCLLVISVAICFACKSKRCPTSFTKKESEEMLTIEDEDWPKRQRKISNSECGLEAEVTWINNIGLENTTNIHIKITPLMLHLRGSENKTFPLWVKNKMATTETNMVIVLNWHREADEKLSKMNIPAFNDIKLSTKSLIQALKQADQTITGLILIKPTGIYIHNWVTKMTLNIKNSAEEIGDVSEGQHEAEEQL